jgi:hypothetical protein
MLYFMTRFGIYICLMMIGGVCFPQPRAYPIRKAGCKYARLAILNLKKSSEVSMHGTEGSGKVKPCLRDWDAWGPSSMETVDRIALWMSIPKCETCLIANQKCGFSFFCELIIRHALTN